MTEPTNHHVPFSVDQIKLLITLIGAQDPDHKKEAMKHLDIEVLDSLQKKLAEEIGETDHAWQLNLENFMTKFHAVMLDETRCEFGASVKAISRDKAYEQLAEDYPESRCVQLESPDDTRERERGMYDDISRGIYRNDDGTIDFIEPGYDEPEYNDEDFDYATEQADLREDHA